MAKASKRALKKGDSSVYQNSVNSITKGGGSKEALSDFNKNLKVKLKIVEILRNILILTR